MTPTLVCDLDGVVFDFDRGWVERFKAEHPGREDLRPGLPQRWNDLHTLAGLDSPGDFWAWFFRSGGFANLPTYPGAVEALWYADTLGWTITYATNRDSDWTTAKELVRVGVPQAGNLLFTGAKWEVPGDVVLEDAPGNLARMTDRAVRVARPWNRIEDYPALAGMRSIPMLTDLALYRVLVLGLTGGGAPIR